MRTFGILLFIATLGVGTYFLITTLPGDEVVSPTEADSPSIRVSEKHARAVDDLADVIDEAQDNAEDAARLSTALSEASIRVGRTARDVEQLEINNSAALPSADAALSVADDARAAAILMGRYTEELAGDLAETQALADQAEEIAEAVQDVEEAQAQANEAARHAEEVRSDVLASDGIRRRPARFAARDRDLDALAEGPFIYRDGERYGDVYDDPYAGHAPRVRPRRDGVARPRPGHPGIRGVIVLPDDGVVQDRSVPARRPRVTIERQSALAPAADAGPDVGAPQNGPDDRGVDGVIVIEEGDEAFITSDGGDVVEAVPGERQTIVIETNR